MATPDWFGLPALPFGSMGLRSGIYGVNPIAMTGTLSSLRDSQLFLRAIQGLKPLAIVGSFDSAFRLALRVPHSRVVSLRSALRDSSEVIDDQCFRPPGLALRVRLRLIISLRAGWPPLG